LKRFQHPVRDFRRLLLERREAQEVVDISMAEEAREVSEYTLKTETLERMNR
jgi:hypothetical protein